jgi:hypothetical protein
VLVKGLIQGALIEIDAIAVLDASESDLDVAKRRKDAGT